MDTDAVMSGDLPNGSQSCVRTITQLATLFSTVLPRLWLIQLEAFHRT